MSASAVGAVHSKLVSRRRVAVLAGWFAELPKVSAYWTSDAAMD